jgi:hypothetical protein
MMHRAEEMPGPGKRGKPKAGFPRFPPPLEIAPRFPHSHSLLMWLYSLYNSRKETFAADRFALAFRPIVQ